MTKILLFVVFLMPDGTIVQGENLDGWAPRQQPDMKTCERRVEAAQFRFTAPSGVEQAWYYCRAIRVE